jgi:hypothetical protein
MGCNRRTVGSSGNAVCFGRIFDVGSFVGSGGIFYLEGILQHLIHGFPLSGPESGHTERRAAPKRRLSRPFSFIRTLTVGFGITPNLLTLIP